MTKTPEIRIYFSWLLYDTVSGALKKAAGKTEALMSKDLGEEYAGNYRREWAKYNDVILPALTGVLEAEFYRDVIDVPCAPWMRCISDPLIMGFQYFPDQFVDMLAHELCHVLLTDNSRYSIKSSKNMALNDRWTRLFGEHDFVTLVHIPVHALSKYIYLDILQAPERLERDMDHVKNDASYKAAWDYVNEHGYMEIIKKLRADYQAIEKELAAK